MAKTGTTQIAKQEKSKNRTSAFIVVTDQYTIGIQLYGVVNGYGTGLHAKDLFQSLVKEGTVKL